MQKQTARTIEIASTVTAGSFTSQVVVEAIQEQLDMMHIQISPKLLWVAVAGLAALIQVLWYNGRKAVERVK
jgi:hypothetical protein